MIQEPNTSTTAIKVGVQICTSKRVKRVVKRRILGYHNFDIDRYVFNIIDNPIIAPIKLPLTGHHNSDRTLLLHDLANQLIGIGLPRCLTSVVIIWVNLIFQNTLRFLVNKQNKAYHTIGDTLLELMNERCTMIRKVKCLW
ncbi:Venom dipeptidyl peptidase 4 [Armadillidium vulgare]|nr:Venom dipeptidyl peptidase 4 [Armadillidium vulgare]